MAVLLPEAQTEIPTQQESPLTIWTLFMLRDKFIHVTPVLPVLFLMSVQISVSCRFAAQARLSLSRRDLSLGAPPALCCAPLVEEVLIYCLHDLVKYVYMNDDQLV